MNQKKVLRLSGILSIFIGLAMLMNGVSSITGFVIADNIVGTASSILGLVFLIGGFLLFISTIREEEKESKLEQQIKLTSLVKKDRAILRLAEDACSNQRVKTEINHLLEELYKGNEKPGVGTENLFGNISYLRGRNGARVFYRPTSEGYEILAYASGTGQGVGKNQNERKVIERLKNLYG